MKFLKYIPSVLTICLIIGISIGYYFSFSIISLFLFLIIGIIALTITYYYSNKKIQKQYVFSFFTLLIFILIGITAVQIQNDYNKENYYQNYLNDTDNSIYFKIEKRLKPSSYYQKYVAEIININKHHSLGKILVNIKKDSVNPSYNVGNIYYTKSLLKSINKPLNPYTFNYSAYLKTKQIKHKLNADKNQLFFIKSTSQLSSFTENIITTINRNLKQKGIKKDELSIINALILGQRQEISKELITAYQNAGAMHILAVSGLHIGILFAILLFVFYPFNKLFKNKKTGKILQYVMAILLIWLYAFLTGFSPSVVRATTMFTAIAIGILVNRHVATSNSLFISAFILLLVNPLFLFDIGFQLSYLAVFSIIYWNPIFLKIWHPKNKIVFFFWSIFIVSLSAQIGILPLSFYYFHQFPALFFVTGLVILPFLGVLLGIGLLTCVLAYFDILPTLLVSVLSFLIETLNKVIVFIAKQEQFLVKEIFFTLLLTTATYFIIIALYRLFEKISYKRMLFLLTSILIVQMVLFYHKFIRENTNEFILFNKNKNTLIAIRKGNNATFYTNMDSIHNNLINNYKIGTGISSITVKNKINNYFHFGKHKILIIDSLGVYKIKKIQPEIVLLQHSPKINIERMIKLLQPKQIIVDASNYNSYSKYYNNKAMEFGISFHNTKEKGAFSLKR